MLITMIAMNTTFLRWISMFKYILFFIIPVAVVGCVPNHIEKTEREIIEFCYDGVVYIQDRQGYTNTSVKLNTDSKVYTTMNNGVSCKLNK